ncbi:putative O-methyltransferase [Delphinella strobiligena]|nr:putative O-methyltransferase [Delphinella strobiligena]
MSVPEGVFTADWHEHYPQWTNVDHYTQPHLHPNSRSNHAVLTAALQHSLGCGLPDIATHPVFSKLMALQCRAGDVQHALEVGTLGGYTSIWLATMNPGLHVASIEVDARHAQVARDNIERAGVSDKVEVILGPGLEVLPRRMNAFRNGDRPPFGFTYIDADKKNNWSYFDLAVSMSKPGACIYVDNIVRRGSLVDEQHIKHEDKDVLGARKLVESVGKDSRVEAVVQQTVAEKSYDGFLMAVVL